MAAGDRGRQHLMAKAATSPCRFLPLLPPITRNVKYPIRRSQLEFSIRAESALARNVKSGKNGNVDLASQLCHRPSSRTSTALLRVVGVSAPGNAPALPPP